MHTNEPREDPLVELGYDHRDVDYKKLRTAILIFLGFFAASAIAGWFIYAYRYQFFAVKGGAFNTNATRRRLPEFPNPELQNNVTAKTDLTIMRRNEALRISGTGYADDAKTRAHIPIDQAMTMIAERGISPTGRSVPAVTRGNDTGQNGMPAEPATPPAQAAEPETNPGTYPGHQTTGSSLPATEGTHTTPAPGNPHGTDAAGGH